MRAWWIPAVLVAAACGGNRPPAAPIARAQPPMKVESVVAACITPPDVDGAITNAAVAGSRAEFCVGGGDASCFSLDLETGGLERLAVAPVVEQPVGAHAETSEPELKVCQGSECQTLTPKVLPGSARIRAATNTNGTFAVFLLGDAAVGKGYAEVWNVTMAKRAASFKYARGAFRCGDVAMLGNTVYVAATECDQPAARAALYTLKGKKLGNVGGVDFGMYGNAFAHLDGKRWAFLEESGGSVAIQDVGTGKVVKTIDMTPLWQLAGAQIGNPGESALLALPAGKLLVIAGAPATGAVGIIDPETGDVKTFAAPHCLSAPPPADPPAPAAARAD